MHFINLSAIEQAISYDDQKIQPTQQSIRLSCNTIQTSSISEIQALESVMQYQQGQCPSVIIHTFKVFD